MDLSPFVTSLRMDAKTENSRNSDEYMGKAGFTECRGPDSNRHVGKPTRDFKSLASFKTEIDFFPRCKYVTKSIEKR